VWEGQKEENRAYECVGEGFSIGLRFYEDERKGASMK
jgi:hypothetical protein